MSVGDRLAPVRKLHSGLEEALLFDTAFVSSKALEKLPNAAILTEIGVILGTLIKKLKAIADQLAKALEEADSAVASTKAQWDEKRKVIEALMRSSCGIFRNRISMEPSSSFCESRLKNFARCGRRKRS